MWKIETSKLMIVRKHNYQDFWVVSSVYETIKIICLKHMSNIELQLTRHTDFSKKVGIEKNT